MVHTHLDNIVGHLRRLADSGPSNQPSDPSLWQRFVEQNDEAAFRTLVERHGPAVLRVCRGVLHGCPDAEDAFQATFLMLARKAGSIRKPAAPACWLYGVARLASVGWDGPLRLWDCATGKELLALRDRGRLWLTTEAKESLRRLQRNRPDTP